MRAVVGGELAECGGADGGTADARTARGHFRDAGGGAAVFGNGNDRSETRAERRERLAACGYRSDCPQLAGADSQRGACVCAAGTGTKAVGDAHFGSHLRPANAAEYVLE